LDGKRSSRGRPERIWEVEKMAAVRPMERMKERRRIAMDGFT
jgi:hypothetical protein